MEKGTKDNLLSQIAILNSSMTGDFFGDLEIKDQIHKLEMSLHNVKPENTVFECFGCGS